jgi:putative hemolysin
MKSMEQTTVPVIRPLAADDDLAALWNQVDMLAVPSERPSKYLVGLACSDRYVEEAQRLRFEVFNVELGEGLAHSVESGLDRDEFDEQMTHLLVIEEASGRVVGTYRMQTHAQSEAGCGLYSARQYDLAPLTECLDEAVELGRACIDVEHRSVAVLLQMWLGIGAFMNLHKQRYLFGCCSITSANPFDGWRAMKTIRKRGFLHPELLAQAMPDYRCGAPELESDAELGEAIKLPKLFRVYMHLGARVISEPAIDRDFGTVDFLVLLDGYEVNLSSLDVLE